MKKYQNQKLTSLPRNELRFIGFGVFRGFSESELPVECFEEVPYFGNFSENEMNNKYLWT